MTSSRSYSECMNIYQLLKMSNVETRPHCYVLSKKRAKVIVTILEELEEIEAGNQEVDINIFDDLVGVVAAREDGSIKHDEYITSRVS